MNNEPLNINDKTKELISKRLQTEYLSSTMLRTDRGTITIVFQSMFQRVTHPYSTPFRKCNFSEKSFKFNQTKFSISTRGPRLWNKV